MSIRRWQEVLPHSDADVLQSAVWELQVNSGNQKVTVHGIWTREANLEFFFLYPPSPSRWWGWLRAHVRRFPGRLGNFASLLLGVLPSFAAEATCAVVLPPHCPATIRS